MNWGWKIVILYSAFAIMTLAMVFYFMGQKVDLVADDYYKQEIAYQDQIDKMSNTSALAQPIGLEYDRQTSMVKIAFPNQENSSQIQGTIHLYRPSNADEDVHIEIKPNSMSTQDISVGALTKGLWKIKIVWTSGDKEYYDEKVITL
jgi:hypothetical protein